jgi:small GTP-binding protein
MVSDSFESKNDINNIIKEDINNSQKKDINKDDINTENNNNNNNLNDKKDVNEEEDKKNKGENNENIENENINKENINNEDDDIISERKISIKNENKIIKDLQVFESSLCNNNLIHSLAFMCQCILVIFDITNMDSFEKAKQIINNIKSEIKIQKPNIILVSTKNDQENNDKNENKIIDNNTVMNFIDEIIQNNINNDSINDFMINYIEISNNTKKGINELKTEILNSYEKEIILLPPLTLSLNQEYIKYRHNNNNNILNINNNNNDKKKSSSTSTKSKSNNENIFNNVNNNNFINTYIKTIPPKNLFLFEQFEQFENKKNKEKVIDFGDVLNTRNLSQISVKNNENIKVILLGDSLVGKTSFLNQFFSKGFSQNLTSTIGINEYSKMIIYKDNFYKIQIWDTAGQERFESIPRQYYEKMEGVFLFYDITNENSFDNIVKWLKDIYGTGNENLIIYILGNKVDLINERKVSYEMGKNFAQLKNTKFMEISCKLDLNISDVVYCMIYDILKIENDFKCDSFSLGEFISENNNDINVSNNVNDKKCC